MEVVNTDTFQPTEHLIGQQNQTLSFGVSNDPALMAMLSTGLYTHPHRTMIQELLFNAWDAHKMNGNIDKPIDVYVNETSGLIVRDYGPGIEPGEGDSNIHGTYCIYGYSSKRKDKNMTGGFGLGTKAPFAYTESFTVTSFWGGTKNVYLIRRVTEDQGGRPGFTPLMKVPSDEHGLLVVIPLKKGDQDKTRMVIRDLVYMSGLKVNLHYEDDPVEELQGYSMTPGEFYIAEEKDIQAAGIPSHDRKRIFAVYGGVRYEIPRDDFYDQDLNFVCNILKDNQKLFIGFAPNSLTPTPNREALNLNEKTKEAIKESLEVFFERFNQVVGPLGKVYIQMGVSWIHNQTKDPLLGLYRCLLLGTQYEVLPLDELQGTTKTMVPENAIDQSIWYLGLRLINKYPGEYIETSFKGNWYAEVAKSYAMLYPEGIKYITQLRGYPTELRDRKRKRVYHSLFDRRGPMDKSTAQSTIHRLSEHKTLVKLDKAVRTWNQKNKHPMVLRFYAGHEGWKIPQFERPYHRKDSKYDKNLYKNKKGSRHHRPSDYSRVYFQYSRGEKDQFETKGKSFHVPDVIILAKTVRVLEEVELTKIRKRYSIPAEDRSSHWSYSNSSLIDDQSFFVAVVHDQNGAYDQAKKYFEGLGYTVYEAPNPVKQVKTVKVETEKRPEGYRVLPLNHGSWILPKGTYPSVDQMILDPEYYLYRVSADMGEFTRKANPSGPLLGAWMKEHPKTVIVNLVTHEKKLKEAGVKNLEDEFPKLFTSWFKDAKRFRTMVLLNYLKSSFRLPLEMLDSPAMRKEFNIPIPASVKISSFREDIDRMEMITNTEYPTLKPLRDWVITNKKFMAPDVNFIQEKQNQFMIFELSRFGAKFKATPEAEQEAFIKKVIKMSKSF